MSQDKPIKSWKFNKWGDLSFLLVTFLIVDAIIFQILWSNLLTVTFLSITIALWLLVLYFFRNPDREVIDKPGLVVSACDGRVTKITTIKEDRFLNTDTIRISVFLSVFNVHVQRAPLEGTVSLVEHQPGKYLQAYKPEASQVNEFIAMMIDSSYGKILVKQIAGILARRCVNFAQSGIEIQTGQRYGLIKFGSRVDLFLPTDAKILITVGDHVLAGLTPMAQLSK